MSYSIARELIRIDINYVKNMLCTNSQKLNLYLKQANLLSLSQLVSF